MSRRVLCLLVHGAIALIYLASPASSEDSPCRGSGRKKAAVVEFEPPSTAAFIPPNE